MPKVSVIVPNYNHGRFLKRRIHSILNQTYQDLELIYLDDCSTDNSEEIFSLFRYHAKIRAFYNTENSGSAFKQCNKGIRLAQGEYIWVAEADDYAERDFLKIMVTALDEHPSVGLAYCQSLAVDEHDNVRYCLSEQIKFLDRQRWKANFINNGRDECKRYLLFKNTIPNFSAVLFRRSIFEEAGFAEESLKLSGDYLTWIKMLSISDIAFIAKPMNYFRHHSGTIRYSTGQGLALLEHYKILAYARDNLKLTREDMNPAYDKVLKRWRRKVFRSRGRMTLQASLGVYRAAREVDPKFHRRMVSQLVQASTCGIFKKIKKVSRALTFS
jgi:glycosyltransferase involved in cell wall biosynthesis